jgi:hypothetical protein
MTVFNEDKKRFDFRKQYPSEFDWFMTILLLTAIFIALTLAGCTSPQGSIPSVIQPQVNKYDMHGTINGYEFAGVGIVPAASQYDMRIESDADINLLTVQTCHRNFSVEDAIKTGWFESNRGFNYVWRPAAGIEDEFSCIIRIGSYNKSVGGQNAWAIVDICDKTVSLPAMNYCDGSQGQSHGCSVCQTHVGLIERLGFDAPVIIDSSAITAACPGSLSQDGKVFEYQMGLGECVYRFAEKASPHRKHRHTTEGYNNILYRGGD